MIKLLSFKEFINNPEVNETTFEKRTMYRKGKLLRHHKVATKPGYTIRNGKMVKMPPLEKRNRRMGSKISVRKRKPSQALSNKKRAKTNRNRVMKGLNKKGLNKKSH